MIDELHVRDLALIEEVWLEFGPGMTVLTGETGTGKTALLGALKLLLGERADSGSVRSGALEALVEGRFSDGSTETVARRRVGADGRSKCALDGEIATVGALADRLGPLVDLHGQHEHQALLSPSTHVSYLDRRAGEPALAALAAYRTARQSAARARSARDDLRRMLDDAARDMDQLHFVAEEISRVDPVYGEDEALEARVPALQHGERLAEAAAEATQLLRGDGGASDRIAQASVTLARVAGIDPGLDALADRLGEAYALLDDTGTDLRAYRDGVEHDPAALDTVLSRLSSLGGLMKRYGPRLEDVLRTRDEAITAIAAHDEGAERMRAAEEDVTVSETALRAAAERLTSVRADAAPLFVADLSAEVSELSMEGTRFEVSFTDMSFEHWTTDGPQRIEFLYAPSTSQPARPLARIASGGELSRVMLALKGVLGEADTVGTLVFDEIDAGVGGQTAHNVGRRLARLAKTHQVIVVTHLAQVAAYATTQLVVSKRLDNGSASTCVSAVTGDARVAEIARMLSGNESDASLAHARELLIEAASADRRGARVGGA